MSEETKAVKRPLSPHLQVYKPQLTSMMSIGHRITGFALSVGLIIPVLWLVSLTNGPSAYAEFHEFMRGGCGLILIFGWVFSLCYHLLNGLRHLMWDAGRGLDLKSTYATGWAVVILSIILTILILYSGFNL